MRRFDVGALPPEMESVEPAPDEGSVAAGAKRRLPFDWHDLVEDNLLAQTRSVDNSDVCMIAILRGAD